MAEIQVYKNKNISNHNYSGLLLKAVIPVFFIAVAICLLLLITYGRSTIETVQADNQVLPEYDFSPYTVTTVAPKLNRVEDENYEFSSSTKLSDRRGYLFDMYFKDNNSPLYGTGDLFAAACDAYGAPRDCVTVVAIAKHETDLCKYPNSIEMNNCWGWGGGGQYRQSFSTIGEGIFTVTRVLVQQYGIRYMEDPSLMERVFCGPDPECHQWGYRVRSLMTELRNFAVSKGIELN